MLLTALEPWSIILIIAASVLLGGGLIFSIVLTFYIAYQVYKNTLLRHSPDSWGRVCSAPNHPEQSQMWEDGLKWGAENKQFMTEVEIRSKEGLKLVGEFFNFGHKKTVIILSGRCECCWYGYYYALPYLKANYNVLVIDARAHGNSEGKYSTAGIKESDDVVRWMEYLQKEYGQEKFALHCICIGSTAGLLAATSERGKNLVEKICLDGAYISFKESYKQHYKAKGHALFPVYYEIWVLFRLFNGVSVNKSYPLKVIKDVKVPILFIFGEKDIFSLKDKSQLLIDAFKGPKEVKWFSEGSHSHLRYANTSEYDETIASFLNKY
jgi:pimeloyl-ACP methyl ester carboxylesterase